MIASGHLMEAKDVREKILSNIDEIKNHLLAINSSGIHVLSFYMENGTTFPDENPLNKVPLSSNSHDTHKNDFLNDFQEMLENVKSLSAFFDVEPGKMLYLSGFYDYAVSCHTLASYIRHTIYKINTDQNPLTTINNASFIKDVPTMSALIPSTNWHVYGKQSYDFRTNWANNNQQNLTNVNAYLSGKPNKTLSDTWETKIYKDRDGELSSLANFVNPANFNEQTRQMHVSSFCIASDALNMFSILRSINEDLGQTISCIYTWFDGYSQPVPTLTVTYKNNLTNWIKGDTKSFEVDYYTMHTVLNMSQLEWTKKNGKTFEFKGWKIEGTETVWNVGSVHKITQSVTLVPYIDASVFKDLFIRKTAIWDDNDGGTTIKNYIMSDPNGIASQDNSGVITIQWDGLGDFSEIKINHLECGINERDHTHNFAVYIVDVNNGNAKTLLVRYRPLPYYQMNDYTKNYHNVAYSIFPNASMNIGRITLKVKNGRAQFKLVAEYGDSDGHNREFYLDSMNGVIDSGGIKGITAYI